MENRQQYLDDLREGLSRKRLSEDERSIILGYATRLIDAGLPVIFNAHHLASLVGYETKLLYAISNAPDKFYRSFDISKASGGKRHICEPLPALKNIQKWILEELVSKLPVSAAAKAYVSGSSIKKNARYHKKQKVVLRADIQNFFPNCRTLMISKALQRQGYSSPVAGLLANIMTKENGLPMGSPTSPSMANHILYEFDGAMLDYANKNGLRYTRYSDDIVVSGNFNAEQVLNEIKSNLLQYNFHINNRKTRIMKRENLQIVTGIVVNEKINARSAARKKLRQEAYYIKKFGLDEHLKQNNIDRANYLEALIGRAKHYLWINERDSSTRQALEALLSVEKRNP